MACTVPVIRWGPNTSSDNLCRCARCTACGHKGATLQHPGWGWCRSRLPAVSYAPARPRRAAVRLRAVHSTTGPLPQTNRSCGDATCFSLVCRSKSKSACIIVPEVFIIFLVGGTLHVGNAASLIRVVDLMLCSFASRFMRLLSRIITIATVPAWMCLHVGPAAAQTFEERWSIIPKAHAEPAPETPHAEPTPPTPEENKPDLQARPPIREESAHGSENRSATRSFNRVFSGKASYYSYQTGKTANGSLQSEFANCSTPQPAVRHESSRY